MSDSPHVAVVRRLYEARGNPDIIRQVLAPDVHWEVVEGVPYGGVYVGAVGSEFFEPGDHVIALGTYTGRAKATGRDFTARFAHVWTLQSDSTVRLQQCADTVRIGALAG